MIEIKVNKPWQNKVAIRDKYVNHASASQEDIRIICQNEEMVIPYEQLQKSILFYGNRVKDKYSNKNHQLIYFKWKPENPNQLKIL